MSFVFGDFFYALRKAGLSIGVSEWMTLMEALANGHIEPDVTDFYRVARALLVKSEAHFDTYDQVFAAIFAGKEMPKKSLEEFLEWLRDPKSFELTPERLAALSALDLDELRRQFEERMREQTERHDGGSRWIGTGGTSPFGHGGVHPSGVRVGGTGRNRSAIQVATAREFRAYRHDRVLDTRALAVALKKLRRISRHHDELELDVEESIDETCKNAGELSLSFRPPRKNDARVLLLMDVGGSMDPHARLVEQLFSAAHHLQHWRHFSAYSFHNCVYAKLEPSPRTDVREFPTRDLFALHSPETFLILVGDAHMAPSELVEPHGAIDYWHMNKTPGLVWLHRLRTHFPRAVWLNPMPESGWLGWTIQIVGELFPMFPLTVHGLEEAVDFLTKGTPRIVRDLAETFPHLAAFEGSEA